MRNADGSLLPFMLSSFKACVSYFVSPFRELFGEELVAEAIRSLTIICK